MRTHRAHVRLVLVAALLHKLHQRGVAARGDDAVLPLPQRLQHLALIRAHRVAHANARGAVQGRGEGRRRVRRHRRAPGSSVERVVPLPSNRAAQAQRAERTGRERTRAPRRICAAREGSATCGWLRQGLAACGRCAPRLVGQERSLAQCRDAPSRGGAHARGGRAQQTDERHRELRAE